MQDLPVASTSQQPLFGSLTFSYQEAARKRGVQACVECRRRKTKCDRVFPCSYCKTQGKQDTCREYQRDKQEAPIGYVPLADFVTLAKRVREHDAALQQLLAGKNYVAEETAAEDVPSFFDSHYPSHDQAGFTDDILIPNTSMYDYSGPSDAHPQPSSRSSDDNRRPSEHAEAAEILEDMAYARGSDSNTTLLGANLQVPRRPTHPFNARLSTLQDFESLPLPSIAQSLISTAVDREWVNMHCFHVPDFLARCQELWTWTPETSLTYFEWQFLALYFAVLATGAAIPSEAELEHIQVRNRDRLVELWATQAVHCLEKGDWTQHQCLTSLQALLLLFPFLLQSSRSEAAINYVASALGLAGRLGLNRLGAEVPNLSLRETEKRYGKRWVEVKRREEGRRVLWNLMDMDCQFTADRHFVFAFFPTQNHACLPHNVEDEALVGHCLPTVSVQRTPCSLNLLRFQMLAPMQANIVEYHKTQSSDYESVKRAHTSLTSIWDNRPSYYQSDQKLLSHATSAMPFQRLAYERQVATCVYLTRLLRIHRPFFPQSLSDSKYSLTLNTCVDSAVAYVNLFAGDKIAAQSARSTGLGTGLFSCNMILLIRLKSLTGPDFAAMAKQLQRGIRLLRQITLGSISKAADFLQQLLDHFNQAEAGSAPLPSLPKGKRKRTTEQDEDLPEAQQFAVSNWEDLFTDTSNTFPSNNSATSEDGLGFFNNFPCPTTADVSQYDDIFGQFLSAGSFN